MKNLTEEERESISTILIQEGVKQNPVKGQKRKIKRDQCNYDIKSQHIQVNE